MRRIGRDYYGGGACVDKRRLYSYKQSKNCFIKLSLYMFIKFTFKMLIKCCLAGFILFASSGKAVIINKDEAVYIESQLQAPSVSSEPFEYPAPDKRDEDLVINHSIKWDTTRNLVLVSRKNIIFGKGSSITSSGHGSLYLKAGMENLINSNTTAIPEETVIFGDDSPQIYMKYGNVHIYYNPQKGEKKHRFMNGQDYLLGQKVVFDKTAEKTGTFKAYMLVNHVRDLLAIKHALHKNYALSQDIDASETVNWENGKGFVPIKNAITGKYGRPFSGDFDGNGYTIAHLHINRPDENRVGLFGMCAGTEAKPNHIENLTLQDIRVLGKEYVGSVAGWVTNNRMTNIKLLEPMHISGESMVGGLVGTAANLKARNISISENVFVDARNIYAGKLFGTADDSYFSINNVVPDTEEIHMKRSGNYSQSNFGYMTTLSTLCFPSFCFSAQPVNCEEK